MKEPTYKEVCEVMKLDLGCARCGSKIKNTCDYCIKGGFNHWKNCYEEAKNIILKRNNPSKPGKGTGKMAKDLDNFLKYLEE